VNTFSREGCPAHPDRAANRERPIAHTPSSPGEPAQSLHDHLRGVAAHAASFVSAFADPAWGTALGLCHDIGKAAPDWQEFVRRAMCRERELSGNKDTGNGPPHAPLGAIHARALHGKGWERDALAFAIAGHHGGLADLENLRSSLRNEEHLRRAALAADALSESGSASGSRLPLPAHLDPPRSKRSVELFVRFLFSALVDADALDTEAYAAQSGDEQAVDKTAARRFVWPQLSAYDAALDEFMAKKEASASPTLVNRLRRRVLRECIASSRSARGSFSLTVPTGGGKTLASLVFGLKHALFNGQHRIVIALPFTAIIDQTADVLRDVFRPLGADVLVEHHSAVDPAKETIATRVAADNWDAPVVVTTQVQLFESLFNNRPSKCRKLHNLANAVIILDEVQSLPHGVLAPILDVLNELVAHYGVTLVLTTATQPSLHTRDVGGTKFIGLSPAPTEIISGPLSEDLWSGLRRVEIHWPQPIDRVPLQDPAGFWEVLAKKVSANERALAIVHLKKDARALYGALRPICPDALHLSASMCPAHRRASLLEARRRLAHGEPCRLVSTQVIEAGVDIDFPVVYRAMAGLESLAQSAGRCNREGALPGLGAFCLFDAPTQPPRGLRLHLDVAQSMLMSDPHLDLFSPATFVRYFDRVYASRDLDSHQVQRLREQLRFEATALHFRMIDEIAASVFVQWDDNARRLIRELRHAGPGRRLLRLLQPYAVGIYPQQQLALERAGALEEVAGYLVLGDFEPSVFYSKDLGLLTEADRSVDLVI
jgi:CRISPR-associated endonuclease/helicase Cas3